MSNETVNRTADTRPADPARRAVIQSAAALAMSQLALDASAAAPATSATAKPTPGKPGDFNFLAGNWKISHRRLKGKEWDEFKGEATCWTILGGICSVEELRIPSRDFSGMGLRLLDVEKKQWCDYWVNGKSGVLTPPPMTGSFENGAGIFIADEMEDGKPVKYRGVWDRITANSCRWYQSVSRDGGKTWDDNWFMEWVRA
ncbi:MAG: hypothetical protein JNN20_13060 [Betaproteobacteria bacterium]|nr:hypothetical protein [Betaproteobacteria bacterium]